MSKKWVWEEIDTSRSGSSGDLGKIFKNEGPKEPGILAAGAPTADATLLAREVIQNSWDAARELESDLRPTKELAPEFEIEFEFRESYGDVKDDLVENLGLTELAARAGGLDNQQIGLGAENCLGLLSSDSALPVLEIREHATTGMYGPFRGTASKMYLTLVSLGFTMKDAGAGGSYGYGKAGLIRGSGIRTVVAYTCFREREDDPGVTRRLLGMTYWGLHDIDDTSFTGFARFGDDLGEFGVVPHENEAADEIAEKLGLEPRDPGNLGDLGTTFLLIDPAVSADDLRVAVERNWWPAIVEGLFEAVIIDADGNETHPRPRKNDELKSFIRAFEVATVPQDNAVATEKQHEFPRDEDAGERTRV